MEDSTLRGYNIEWHRDVTDYLSSNGSQAFDLLTIVFLVCFSFGLIELFLFLLYSADFIILVDCAMFFLNSACFITGMVPVSRSIHDWDSKPVPFLDIPLRDIMNFLPVAILIMTGILSLASLPYSIAAPARNSAPTLYLSLVSSIASCALVGTLKISNFKKPMKNILLGGRSSSVVDSGQGSLGAIPTSMFQHTDVEYGSLDRESLPDNSSSSSKAIRILKSPYVPSEPRTYTIGQKVVAHWTNDGISSSSVNISGSWLPATVSHVHEDGTLDVVYEDGELETKKVASQVETLDMEILQKAKEAEENDIVRIWVTALLMHMIFSVVACILSFFYFEFTLDGGSVPDVSGVFSFFYCIFLTFLTMLTICGALATMFFCWKLWPIIFEVINGHSLTVAVLVTEGTTNNLLNRQEVFHKDSIRITI